MPVTFLANEGANATFGSGLSSGARMSLGFYQALDEVEAARIQRYVSSWRFYFGQHWAYQREDGEPLITLNYYRKIIDKLSEFLVGKGFIINVPNALEDTTKAYLDDVWESNKRDQLASDIALMGGVTGDAFVMITYQEVTDEQKRVNPNAQGMTRIQLLGSEQCFPAYDPLNMDKMIQMRIETVYRTSKEIKTPGVDVDDKGNNLSVKRITQIITSDRILEQYHGEIPTIRPNILGEIPVVHVRNMSVPREIYGMSDGADIMGLNRELNEKSTDISDIINYHSAPITIIVGAKAKNLERGPRALWSGLPQGAQVFNLALEGDLGAAQTYWDKIKKTLHELSDVPAGVLGEDRAISNTSGVALHIQYQPILGRTKRKRNTYEPGFQKINYFILRIGMVKNRIRLPYDLCKNCGGRILEYDDPHGETEWLWNDVLDSFEERVRRIKRCFHIDKLTLDFMNPEDMHVRVWRRYGVGDEVVEVPIRDAREMVKGRRSFWDYFYYSKEENEAYEAELASVRGENDRRLAAANNDLGQVDLLEEPSKPKLQVRPLPSGEVMTYEEPMVIKTVTPLYHPRTGQLLRTVEKNRLVVPTDCRIHSFLNPYENFVTFNDVLPKDEALQATLYEIYQRNQWVDTVYVQSRIPGVAEEMTAINRRMKANPQPSKEKEQAAEGFINHTNTELTPAERDLTAVPGSDGNPVKFGTE
jgi:Phage portal protein, SPP1 Gp6-like